jgi:oxygen-independent coproporphyrinogen-3 oxidase
MIRHVYVHIPFCARICPYCAFYKDLVDRSETPRFCEAIVAELREHARSRHVQPSTIYFGGGTPTALTTAQLNIVLTGFRDTLDLSKMVEWTVEANPGSVSAPKAALLLEAGVNRISLGVQSLDDGLLNLLGREHSAHQAEESVDLLRAAGLGNLNVDLMFGLPGQTAEQWRDTLERTVALGPDHISAYCLTFEEDTDFFLRHSRGEFRTDENVESDFFETAMSILQEAGYEHYEISNYARPGFRSLHNSAYWKGEDYLGIGPSAFSTNGLERTQNVCDYRRYADLVLSGQPAVATTETLSEETKRTERIALGLRTDQGIAASALQDRHRNTATELVSLGLLRREGDRLRLTTRGKSLADEVAGELL